MNEEKKKDNIQQMNNNINKKQKKKGPYLLGQTLGEGAFAKVKVATQIHTNEKTAIKILDKSRLLEDERDVQRFKKEINILKKLHHKNIIQLYEIMESKKSLYIVMEYCEKGELFDYIVNNGKLSEEESCRLFQQIINGVEYLHEQSIIHRDLKPENILLDNNINIKISDFGLSTFYDKNTYLQTPCGTPSYAPPEMLNGNAYNGTSSDIWSCGIILYAMLCGSLPFAESKEDIICKKILNHDYIIPNFLSKNAKDLLNHIMKINPLERYTIQQIKNHPWFNLVNPHLIGGITIGVNHIPVDDNILDMVEKYNFDREKCKQNILNNRFDSITCVYYLCLKKYIREGNNSVSDLTSCLFEEFLKNDYLRINKETIIKENEIERPKTARTNIKNIIIKDDKSTIENDDNRIKSNGQVEISKTQAETEISLKSNRSYINNDEKSPKNDKYKKNKKIDKEMGNKSQKNLNYIPILKNENKKMINGNNNVKSEENEKEINIKDNNRKFSGNSSNNNIFKTKKIDQIKTNLNKNKNSFNNSNPKLIVTNVTVNNIVQNKIKNKGQDLSSYRQNNTNNLNLRTKGKKKNSNIGSSTELSTLIRKKIKEFSRSIVIPTLKEPNNIIKTTNNTNNTIKITDISLKKENGSEIKKEEKENNNINILPKKEIKNEKNQTLNNNNIILTKENNGNIEIKSKLNNKINGNEYNQKSALEQRETYRTYRNDVKEGRTASQHKSSPFPLDKISLDDDESLFLDDEKPVNVLDYIARRLVASSFCGSCNFQSSQNQQNNHHIDFNYNQISKNENNFKNLISILNQKFKNFILKENLGNYQDNNNNNNNKNNKNDKFYFKKNFKNENSIIDYNINNTHYNKFLDISTNYDPALDSRGESSVERSLSIKSNEFRNFSFSPERKAKNIYEQNNINSLNLNSSFNISTNNFINKTNGNYIGIISEDEEYEFLDKERIKKSKKNKKLFPFPEKKVTINLSMTLNNTVKKQTQNVSNNSNGNLQIKKKNKKRY